MAPEIFSFTPYNGYKSDVFSLGVILFALVVGHFPFHSAKKSDRHYQCLCANKQSYNNSPQNIINEEYWNMTYGSSNSDEFKHLIEMMLAHDPNDRISIHQIRSHPWIHGKVNPKKMQKIKQSLMEASTVDVSIDDSQTQSCQDSIDKEHTSEEQSA